MEALLFKVIITDFRKSGRSINKSIASLTGIETQTPEWRWLVANLWGFGKCNMPSSSILPWTWLFFRQSVYTGNIAFWNWSPENTNKTMFVLNSVNLQWESNPIWLSPIVNLLLSTTELRGNRNASPKYFLCNAFLPMRMFCIRDRRNRNTVAYGITN